MKRTEMLRRTQRRKPKTPPKQPADISAAASVFWLQTCRGKRCTVCDEPAPGRNRGEVRLEAHHVVPKRYLKVYARDFNLDEAATLALLYDPANGLCVCADCHQRHEKAHTRIPRALLPARCVEFARKLGLLYTIDRFYSEGDE